MTHLEQIARVIAPKAWRIFDMSGVKCDDVRLSLEAADRLLQAFDIKEKEG